MGETRDVYRRLQKHIDAMPVGFPAAASEVELRVLEHLFTPEEAEIALCLGALPEPLGRIHRRVRGSGISKEELEASTTGLEQQTDEIDLLLDMYTDCTYNTIWTTSGIQKRLKSI